MTLSNLENDVSAIKTGAEPERTVEFWRRKLSGMERRIFDMVVFEKGLEDRDRLPESQVTFLIERRRNKKIA